MSQVDNITEVNKNIDNIEHVEKFNPFHDARGRFSNAHGMASYSANPKTKAGQMAIGRSTAAGYGAVMNVHRESKGENIRQNDNWIRSGQKPNASQLSRAQANAPKTVSQARQNAHTNRVKGTMGATETASAKHPRPKKHQQAQTQKPTAKPQTQKPQNQQQPKTTPAKTTVDGKDISQTFKTNPSSKKQVFDQVCEQQGFTGKPQLVDRNTFHAAETASGIRGFRTWGDHGSTTAQDFKRQLSQSDDFEAAGHGGRVYGGGTYIAINSTVKRGTKPDRTECQKAYNDSRMYGSGNRSTATVTLDPSAKIANYNTMARQFRNETLSVRRRFGSDVGAYAAAKGYDAMIAKDAGWGCDYATVFNRTKLIVLND